MGALPDSDVLRQDGPRSFAIERGNPIDVGDVRRELVAQRHDFVLDEKSIECLGEAWAQIMIQQQFQAASCCWKTTASRTATNGISYSLATFSADPSIFTAPEMISVG